jgi:hypothetical protein
MPALDPDAFAPPGTFQGERPHVLNQALTYFCLDLLEGSRPR